MRPLEEIADNPRVTVITMPDKGLTGYIRLRKSGKPRDYTLIIGADETSDSGRIHLEHASIACFDHSHIPSWEEMCECKNIIWKDEEECYQVFPKKSQYVNLMKNCMHIWRDKDANG